MQSIDQPHHTAKKQKKSKQSNHPFWTMKKVQGLNAFQFFPKAILTPSDCPNNYNANNDAEVIKKPANTHIKPQLTLLLAFARIPDLNPARDIPGST
jgi:hypothetical protein